MNKSIIKQEGDIKPKEQPRYSNKQDLNNDLEGDGEEGFSQYNSSNGGAFHLVTNNIKNQNGRESKSKRLNEQMKSTPVISHTIEGETKVSELEQNGLNEIQNSPPAKSISVIK